MVAKRKNKLLIVDDSLIYCEIIAKTLSTIPGVEIAGKAINAKDADEKLKNLNPDIVIVDMTINGIMRNEFIEKASAQYKADIIIISSLRENNILMSEAVKYVPKPANVSSEEKQRFLSHLTVTTRRVLLERTNKNIQSMIAKRKLGKTQNDTKKSIEEIARENVKTKGKIVVIGASTGGTEATVQVVSKFPANMPPVLIVQHMPPGFTDMYAQRLNRICNMKAKEAKHLDRVEAGQILVAPGMKQMRIAKDSKGYYVTCKEEEKVSGHCPSVDVIFESVAKVVGANSIGIILTGMGADGSNGLLKMREKGAFTIGQDQDSCVVYGMPKVAFSIGAVKEQHSIEKIGNRVLAKLGIK